MDAQQQTDSPATYCRTCGAEIRWEVTKNGKRMPIDVATGDSHFATCRQSTYWRGNPRQPVQS